MFKRIWITCNGKESNRKRKRRKIQSTTLENTSSGSGSVSACDSVSVSACDSGSGGDKYEVFLSFRGEDTRKGFADYLFTDLTVAGIRTFRDNNDLRVGEEIGPELLNAIQESKICIPIFSKNYSSSKWFLRELAHMVTKEKKIIPIFYDVEPSDVRHQRGSYRKAFRQHDKYFDKKTVQEWKEALKKVAALKGFELKKQADGHEGKLAKMVVEEVFIGLKKNYMHVPDLVGMDHHVDKMKGLLNVDSNGVRIVGIHGMGGLGKTTIAKFIYNQLCETESYKCCCFLEDIRETSQQKGLIYLQNQLLSTIRNGKGRVIDNVDNGIEEIKNAVKGKKVLIVLDDVNEKSQFDKLAGNCDCFGSGSRIIVTTRNEEALNGLKVTCKKEGQLQVYQPKFMNLDHSLQVFSKHAFETLSPPKDYESLSKEVVSYAAGLPLVLVVTGSLLRGEKDTEFWEETMKKLKNIPADDVMERLRISYDPLDNGQKQIFLDIACLFVGEDKTNLFYMWEDCGFYPQTGINVLVRRSLIKVGDGNTIWMHDQVRDLGRRIVDEENLPDKGKRSRLWRPEEALSIWESHTGTNKVVALRLDLWEYPARRLVGKDFKELRNLRYLRLGCADLDGDFQHRFSNLRWLECFWGCRGIFKLTNLGLKNLVVLQLSGGHITDDWKGWSEIKMATKLKVLHLSGFYWLTSASLFYSFSTLESLDLCGCQSLRSLDGLEQLKSLTYLNISGCTRLKRLRDLSNLKKLKKLKISWCSELIEIQDLDRLESLQLLDIKRCGSIERLPDLSNLRMLKELILSDCNKLCEVEGLAALESLERLDLSGCSSLKRSPDLKLRFGGGLDGLEEVKLLEWLHISQCKSIDKLPDLSSRKNLRWIYASGCEKLTEIRVLGKSLEPLDLGGCYSIKKLPNLSSLENLRKIDVSGRVKLTKIGGLAELKSLESLDICGCKSIKKLPDLSSLKILREINASDCVKLTKIGGLGELKSLQSLYLGGCKSIEKLPNFSSLENLREIDSSGCVKLTEIGGLGELKSLESLDIRGCESIEKLPDLSSHKNLRWIDASGCMKLTEIGGLEELKSLESLKIRGCKSIEKLPDLSSLKNLIQIDVSNNVKLTEIRGLGELKSLESLDIARCESIEKLPDLSNLRMLKHLMLSGCVKLLEVEGLATLESLEALSMSGCTSLEKLPYLSSLKNLRWMDASGCVKLTDIGGFGELESLESLLLHGCKSIEKLPDLSSHKNLRWIIASGCVKLTEIAGLGESLALLDLDQCKSIEKLPDLSSLQNLRRIIASGCVKLTEIGGLRESLESLDIRGCELLGNLPCLPNTTIITD